MLATLPLKNVIDVVWTIVIPSATAVKVALPAVLERIVKLATPDTLVVFEITPIVSVPPRLELSLTTLPESPDPEAFLTVTPIVTVDEPSATTDALEAKTVVSDAEMISSFAAETKPG